jgi:hypothetical protein
MLMTLLSLATLMSLLSLAVLHVCSVLEVFCLFAECSYLSFHLLTCPDLYCSGWAKFADWGQVESINNLAGSVSWWFGLALWITSVNYVRRRWYSVSEQKPNCSLWGSA